MVQGTVPCPPGNRPLSSDGRPPLPKDATVTMAYVPLQTDIITYDEDKALQNGTLFPTLNKVFLGGSAK